MGGEMLQDRTQLLGSKGRDGWETKHQLNLYIIGAVVPGGYRRYKRGYRRG